MQTQTPKMSSLKPETHRNTFEHCLMSLTLSSSPDLGDYVGIESCLDLKGNDDITESFVVPRRLIRSEKLGKSATRKEFPPPIPLLARTENLSSHMPWVLRRYYTSDGRLVLKEERVKHHEYFRAQRCNGRLTLQLIPLDDEVDNYPPCLAKEEEDEYEEEEEEEEEEEDNDNDEEEEEDVAEAKENHEEVKDCEKDYVVYEDHQRINNNNKGGINGGIGGNLIGSPCKLLNYSAMIQNSACIFQMPVPALRPVHT